MKLVKKLLLATPLLCMTFVVSAQDADQPITPGMEMHFGYAMPMGKFGKGSTLGGTVLPNLALNPNVEPQVDDITGLDDGLATGDGGYAKNGINLGLKYYSIFPKLEINTLFLVLGVDAYYSKTTTKFTTGVEESWRTLLKDEIYKFPNNADDTNPYDGFMTNYTHPSYFNIAFAAGAAYFYPFNLYVSVYAEASIGANLSIVNEFKVDNAKALDPKIFKYTQTYKPGVSYTANFSLGVMLSNSFSLSWKLATLGSYKYKYEGYSQRGVKYGNPNGTKQGTEEKPLAEGVNNTKFSRSFPINYHSVVLGIKF
ncbi:hypothetical protein AGMMS4956_19920 [Bacteroidia bacterium]|nr:hypothetical protein AGMMS4956_19920 [Bacteroidia bacterium]